MNQQSAKFALAPLLLTLALGGCVQGPDYQRPRHAENGAIARGNFVRASDDTVTASPELASWWRALGDKRLDNLVERGLTSAPSQAAAIARVRQARSLASSARAERLPVISASGTYVHADLPEGSLGDGNPLSGDLFSVGADTMWEVDLWGSARRKAERANAEADAAEARLANAQVTLSAEITRTYLAALARRAERDQLDHRRALEIALAKHAEERFAAGATGRQPVESALAQVARTNTEIATAKADQAVLVDALAVLIGQEPGSLDAEFAGYVDENAIPLPPDKVEIGEPAALIARRPDIRVAERQLAAATAQIGVAEAARFPKLSFLGLIGIGGGDPGDVLDPDNLTAIAVPRISWSFLDFGRAKRGVEQTQFARDAAAAEYDQTVLVALQDVEAALARFAQQRTTFANALRTARHLDSIAELEAQRARAGTVGRPAALEAERAALDARRGAIVARAELTRSYATLAKALGLGWRGGADAPSPIEGSNANEP